MAPEQASGSEVAAQADIYALGATIFKLLTGTAPHGRSADIPIIEFLHRLANDPAPRLDAKREQVPSSLCDLLESMLHRDPERRETSAEVVGERLENFADGADLQDLVSRVPDQFIPTLEKPRGAAEQTGAVPGADSARAVSTSRPPVGPVGWGALALASASLFGLILLAISTLLKTPDGDFLIESDVLDSLTVEVVDEKDRVELIAVDQGKAETSLRAGRYRIRLGLPSDQVEITPNVITISNKEAAIAKITRIESDKAAIAIAEQVPIRDPSVAATARIELIAVVEELDKAKMDDKPDEIKIETLQQRISQLRALSQPIPTEPVYKGRTLADWTAQMQFEQALDAKEDAAKSVLYLMTKLSQADLPSEQRMEIGFESYALQAAWSRNRGLEMIPKTLSKSAEQNRATRFYRGIDRKVASTYLAAQLRNDDQTFRRHALTSCLYLKHEIRNGEWPGVFDALNEAANLPGESQRLAQFTLAICCPDTATASKEILKIDMDGITIEMLTVMVAALDDPHFDIPKSIQFDWTIDFISHTDGKYINAFQDETNLLGGPLADIDWDDPSVSQQADIDVVASGLMDRVQQAMDDAIPLKSFSTNEEHNSQIAVAKLTAKLPAFIRDTSLGEAQSKRAIGLLQKRVYQLVNLRDRSTETPPEVFGSLDKPADAAGAILLLGGEVPRLLKATPKPTSHYFEARVPSPQFFATELKRGSYRTLRESAGWFPYQVMPALDGTEAFLDALEIQNARTGIDALINTLGDSDHF